MSTADATILRCDRPKCQAFVRLPLDSEHLHDPRKLHELAAAAGWTQFQAQGLVTYTADYCPTHKGSGMAGIRGWGQAPTPLREDVEAGLVVHRSRRAIRNSPPSSGDGS